MSIQRVRSEQQQQENVEARAEMMGMLKMLTSKSNPPSTVPKPTSPPTSPTSRLSQANILNPDSMSKPTPSRESNFYAEAYGANSPHVQFETGFTKPLEPTGLRRASDDFGAHTPYSIFEMPLHCYVHQQDNDSRRQFNLPSCNPTEPTSHSIFSGVSSSNNSPSNVRISAKTEIKECTTPTPVIIEFSLSPICSPTNESPDVNIFIPTSVNFVDPQPEVIKAAMNVAIEIVFTADPVTEVIFIVDPVVLSPTSDLVTTTDKSAPCNQVKPQWCDQQSTQAPEPSTPSMCIDDILLARDFEPTALVSHFVFDPGGQYIWDPGGLHNC